jgi:hypothetical protein
MSFFYITNDTKSIPLIKNTWNINFDKIETFELKHNLILIATPAFKKNLLYKKTKYGYIYGFGTFFNNNGFANNAMLNIEDLKSLELEQLKGLYGHYKNYKTLKYIYG